MFRIFKEFASNLDAYGGDPSALLLNIIGGGLIGLTFLIIGVICIVLAKTGAGATSKKRAMITRMFGLFLVSCAFSRFLSVLCIWHNYAILDGWVKVLTGLLALFTILYLPSTIRQVLSNKKLEEAHQMLEKTQQDLNEVRQLSEKLTDNK